MKLLLVEDDPGISLLVREKLTASGLEVKALDCGKDAYEYLKNETPDLMVLDYSLPDYDGMEIINKIISEDILLPPFVVATGRGDEKVAVEMMKLGARDYVVKDSDFLMLLPEIIKKVVKEIENDLSRKKAEAQKKIALEALRISERQYRRLFEDSTDAIFLVEIPSGRYMDANNSALGLSGRKLEDLKELKISDVSPLGSEERMKTAVKATEAKNMGEVVFVRPDGSERIALLSIVPLDEYTVYAIAHDITDRKIVEEALRESEEVFRRAFLTSPDSVNINKIEDGLYVNINEGFTRITGYTNEDVEGKTSKEIDIWVNYEDREKLVAGLKENGVVINLEAQFRKKDGNIVTGLMSASIISIKGKPHILSITRDIESRKIVEKELEKYRLHLEEMIEERTNELKEMNKLLQKEIELKKQNETKVIEALKKEKELNEMKSSFISTVSHEFRTPLATILSSFELLKAYGGDWKTEKHDKHYNRVIRSIDQLTGMIDDVLVMNKVDTGKLKYSPQKIKLSELLISLRDETELQLTKRHQLKTVIDLVRDEYIIDEKLFRMIVNNLLSNAVKYSPDGGIIEFLVKEKKGELEIKISDEGIGISDEDKKNIFNAFYRSESVNDIPGSGLGLSIVQRAVRLQEGSLDVISELGKGSQFVLKIPK